MFSTYKRVFWLSLVMAFFVYLPFAVDGFSTDVWIRLTRIKEWSEAGFPWPEQLMMSQNYPFGFEMHWTRPLDFIGYAFAWPFIPNWGIKDALEIMSFYVPVLVLLTGISGFYYGLKGYVTPKIAFFSFWLFFYGIGYNWGQGQIGYFDHHIFHSTLLIWCIALTARYFRQPHRTSLIVTAGFLTGLGTWMTPEFFINSYILITPFLTYWLLQNKSLRPALLYTLTYSITLLLAMTFDHPMSGFWTLDLYRPSLMHVILGLGNVVVLSLLSIPLWRHYKLSRLIYALLFFTSLGIFFVLNFDSVLLVPMVDPFQYHFWTKKVTEMAPLYNNWANAFVYAICPLILTLGLSIWFLCHLKDRLTPLVMISCLGSLIYIPIAFFHMRAGISQQAFFVFLATCYLSLSFHTPIRSFKRELIFVIFYMLFIGAALKGTAMLKQFKAWGITHYLTQYRNDSTTPVPDFLKEGLDNILADEKNDLDNKKTEIGPTPRIEDTYYSCQGTKTIFDKIKSMPGTGGILVPIFNGPEVLWQTNRPILGGPYDRNMEGLTDLFFIEFDKPPFTRAKALLEKHKIELLFMNHPTCQNTFFLDDKGQPYEDIENSFWHTVYYQKKKMPKWLKLEYFNHKTNIKIFRII